MNSLEGQEWAVIDIGAYKRIVDEFFCEFITTNMYVLRRNGYHLKGRRMEFRARASVLVF